MDTSPSIGALAGLRVLDVTQLLAGSFCSQMLADHGADVIKIEPPGGDAARGIGPFLADDELHAYGPLFQACNRNKRGMVLDLKQPEARAVFLRLVAEADCVVENFRTGVMERFGLGYETLAEHNPRLVYTSVRGFGDPRGGHSPYSDWPAVDVVAQAMGGVMGITGPDADDPTKVGGGHGDFVPGLFAAFGTMAALWEARQSGRGQYVDVGMVDSVLALCELIPAMYSYAGRVPKPAGSRLPPVAPFGRVRAKDGYIVIGVTPGPLWPVFCNALGRPDLVKDPHFATPEARVKHQDALYALIEETTLQKTKTELAQMLGGKVAFGPVYDAADIFADTHFSARDMLPRLDHPGSKKRVAVPGIPPKLTRTPGTVRHRAPLLGEHTAQILAEVGYGAAEVANLLSSRAVI